MRQEILHIMPTRFRGMVKEGFKRQPDAEEIRIRVGQAPEILGRDKSVWLPEPVTAEDIEEMLTFISRYSIYAYEEEIRQGFLTIEGGSRIGFAGKVRLHGGTVSRMTNIRFLNIRIAREQKGCAGELMPWLFENGEFLNTLLISKPGAGKTTCLRDIVRLVSDGEEKSVLSMNVPKLPRVISVFRKTMWGSVPMCWTVVPSRKACAWRFGACRRM